MPTDYETGLGRNAANYVPLSPLSFLRRTASVYPERPAIIHGPIRRNYAELSERCLRLASALAQRGVGRGDTVAIIAPNIPEFVEAHFGVPMAGAVLNSINTRLDADAIAFILRHGEAKVFFVDRELSAVAAEALAMLETKPLVIDINDPLATGGALIGEMEYEAFIAAGDPGFTPLMPLDEWDAIALNYTSGTTGDPKGVVSHHRGAYLNAIGNGVTWAMPHFPVYLWTLPMFHCNGWCFPWTITALAGTHVCLRRVEGTAILTAIAEHGVTHLCGAPIVMSMMVNAPEEVSRAFAQPVSMMTAGAAPPASVIGAMEAMDFKITHVYGLTEVYGPCVVCAWHPEWNDLPANDQARLKARQGVPYELQEDMIVADPVSLAPVPSDGVTIGEIMMRGNVMMKGYLKNPATTEASFKGGWFHTGDLAVMHPDGYVEIKDRSKDIIISGGENISSIEVEDALFAHPDILSAAVVAMPDEKWGETPCAFVELKPGAHLVEEAVIDWCRERLARFKCPRRVVFTELPKTSTGKIQKFVLREQARALASSAG
ncbi:MAG: acyl-CoA synthetase [Neomegalonema sp.]|nr:acyl-CoA synthetase [Neomegalonema sp.]